jgi:hypothetical protein
MASTTGTTTITDTASAFFEACETGQGWDGCSRYCHPEASFSAQAEPSQNSGPSGTTRSG